MTMHQSPNVGDCLPVAAIETHRGPQADLPVIFGVGVGLRQSLCVHDDVPQAVGSAALGFGGNGGQRASASTIAVAESRPC